MENSAYLSYLSRIHWRNVTTYRYTQVCGSITVTPQHSVSKANVLKIKMDDTLCMHNHAMIGFSLLTLRCCVQNANYHEKDTPSNQAWLREYASFRIRAY